MPEKWQKGYVIPVTRWDLIEFRLRKAICGLLYRHRPAHFTLWKCRCNIWWNYGRCGGRNK